jgi:predicted nuclease of predicted toxin-antitoxin system
MKFLIDAQLPYGLKLLISSAGFDAIHTDDLPDKERTTDNQIREISINENRIVVSKDADFVDSFYLQGTPKQLLLISTGNIRNKELYNLVKANLPKILELFIHCALVEINNDEIIGHE